MSERDDGVQPVAELGGELAIDRFVIVAFPLLAHDTECLARRIGGTGIGAGKASWSANALALHRLAVPGTIAALPSSRVLAISDAVAQLLPGPNARDPL